MLKAFPLIASLRVFASLIFVFFVTSDPVVIANATTFGLNPSGNCPVSLRIRTVSPLTKLCGVVNVI